MDSNQCGSRDRPLINRPHAVKRFAGRLSGLIFRLAAIDWQLGMVVKLVAVTGPSFFSCGKGFNEHYHVTVVVSRVWWCCTVA